MTTLTEEQYQAKIRELEKEVKKLNLIIQKDSKIKYGLRWIDVPEAFEKDSENKIPILEEVKENAIKNNDGKPTHILIEGDNYHALKCLNYTHKGKIDVIYIDPPYNTGSDGFTYKDKRFLSQFPDGTTIPKEHPLRHSTWLSFMSKRLELAKNLLSEKGVIFISIDDNEQANLKLLCDEIFGEECFVATIPWRKRTAKSDVPFGVSQDYEWILAYAKSVTFKASIESNERKYYETKDFPNRPWRFHDMSTQRRADERPNSDFTIINPKNGKEYPVNKMAVWRITKNDFQKYYDEGRIIFPGDYDFLKISKPVLRYWKEDDIKKAGENFGRIAVSTKLPDSVGMSQDGTKEITDLLNSKVFMYPKSTELIKFLINISTSNSQSSTVLDFFAGSGTTLHATMKLNSEDGGKRQCILVQQKEKDNNICQNITYERNRRVMQGYTNPKGEEISGLGNSLKYFRTAFVGENEAEYATDKDKIALSKKAGCLLSMAENTLEEYVSTDRYQIFGDDKNVFTGIYFSANADKIHEFAAKLEQLRNLSPLNTISAYFFTSSDGSEFISEFENLKNIKIKSIPEPILEVYRRLN